MDDTERLCRNNAIYTDHNSRTVTRWLEKKAIELHRDRLQALTDQLSAEQAKDSTRSA